MEHANRAHCDTATLRSFTHLGIPKPYKSYYESDRQRRRVFSYEHPLMWDCEVQKVVRDQDKRKEVQNVQALVASKAWMDLLANRLQ